VSRYCLNCGHGDGDHGDRAVGGICRYGRMYPDVCGCDEYREGVTNGPAVGAP
jgi:hypothetical protein